MTTKTCTKCKQEKETTQYHKLKRGRNGLNPVCNACRNKSQQANREQKGYRAQIKYMYGLSYVDYLLLIESQNGVCVGCQKPFYILNDNLSIPCVDHCHTTKKVRGILCKRCTLALGYVQDNVTILEGLLTYLKKIP